MIFHNWLDSFDESKAARGDLIKAKPRFALDLHLASGVESTISNVDDFCAWSKNAAKDGRLYDLVAGEASEVSIVGDLLTYRSPVVTDVHENNQVYVKVTGTIPNNQALIVFHHWNASSRNKQLTRFLAGRGVTVFEVAMPYHFERARPSAAYADYMLSANLGRTLQSMRQAVLDGRALLSYLQGRGFKCFSVLGFSLGSWIAGLVAANDPVVSKASLFLTGASLAEMVHTGRATRAISEVVSAEISMSQFASAWMPLDLGFYSEHLSRSSLNVQLVLAKRDTVVLPSVSSGLCQRLAEHGAEVDLVELNCGHYSMGLPPYIVLAGMRLKRFLI